MLKKLMVLSVVFSLTLGCSNTKMSTDYETVYDFSALQTFYVLPADEKVYDNPRVSEIDIKRIGDLIPEQLAAKYRPAAKDQADFWVRYFLVVEEKMRVDNYNANFGFYPFGFGHRYGVGLIGTPGGINRYYQQGSVIVDIIDAKTEEVIWRGVTEGRLVRSDTPQQRITRMRQQLERMFSLFPPETQPQ